jgi:hypothetical protein
MQKLPYDTLRQPLASNVLDRWRNRVPRPILQQPVVRGRECMLKLRLRIEVLSERRSSRPGRVAFTRDADKSWQRGTGIWRELGVGREGEGGGVYESTEYC